MRNCLVLGGGGFIGTTFYRDHAQHFDRVTLVDHFVGASHPSLKSYDDLRTRLRTQDRLLACDVSAACAMPGIFEDVSVILILNADTGTARSYDRPSYTADENITKLALIAETIRRRCDKSVRVLFTSSRAVYGEGHWQCPDHGKQRPNRSAAALRAGDFAPQCPACRKEMQLRGSRETDPKEPMSVYGLTKATGELLLEQTLGPAGFDVRIVRFQNVYGAGQAKDNPYTGVLNWFSKAMVAHAEVPIFEDARIVRDFIYVDDAAAMLYTLASAAVPVTGTPFIVNGGTGVPVLLKDVAAHLAGFYKSKSKIVTTKQFRQGDVLGAYADDSLAKTALGFNCSISLEVGLSRYAAWFLKE